MKRLALFDFDGTITKKDSFLDFLQFTSRKRHFIKNTALLSPMLINYFFKRISKEKAKEAILHRFFYGMPYTQFVMLAEEYTRHRLPKILRPKALERIVWHKNNHDTIAIVSGSIYEWLTPWCTHNDLILLSTGIAVEDGKISGKLGSENCIGVEKVRRINERFNLKEYTEIYAYGNSSGDKEMLALATHPFYKPF